MRTLVVGCDASGKSTLLESIRSEYGDEVIESTATEESRRFKKASVNRLIDDEYIRERERLYLKLTEDTLKMVSQGDVKDFVGTDASIVTRLSHAAMRQCIGGPTISTESIIRAWINDESTELVAPPDIIVLTHAPLELIKGRISVRQQAGMKEEKFWGFNSPFFLNEYQKAWRETIKALAITGLTCVEFDTSVESPEHMMQVYGRKRAEIEQAGAKVPTLLIPAQ